MDTRGKKYTVAEKTAIVALLELSRPEAPKEGGRRRLIRRVKRDETLTPEQIEEKKKELVNQVANYSVKNFVDHIMKKIISRGPVRRPDDSEPKPPKLTLRKRLERFINEDEVKNAKYHENMKREYSSAVDRPLSKQISREKNNAASRLSRLRVTNAQKNLAIEAENLDKILMAKRMKQAYLLNYLKSLHTLIGLREINFDCPARRVIRRYRVDWRDLRRYQRKRKDAEKAKAETDSPAIGE